MTSRVSVLRSESGFTLPEILVSLVVASFLFTAISLLLITATREYLRTQAYAEMLSASEHAFFGNLTAQGIQESVLEIQTVSVLDAAAIDAQSGIGSVRYWPNGEALRFVEGSANGVLSPVPDTFTLQYFGANSGLPALAVTPDSVTLIVTEVVWRKRGYLLPILTAVRPRNRE